MKRLKQILNKLLFPPLIVVLLCVPVAAGLLIYVFACQQQDTPAAYASYVLSAYALTILCVHLPSAAGRITAAAHRNRFIHRYLTDIPFRTHLSLYLSFGINLLYAVIKFLFGIYYRSVWFETFGVYYSLLAVMRLLLLRHVKRSPFGTELISEWKRYRLCGIILIPMNIVMAGIMAMVVAKNEGFEYAGYLIYIMAMYAFYAVITAIINVIRYRCYQSPVMSAAKVLNLAAALVSMLSLETAMLTQFASESDSPHFIQIMTATTGGAVCVFVLGAAIYMIAHSSRKLKELQTG